MKIIDKTPLQDEKGEISTAARIQGTLKYGLNWYNDLQAQKVVIDQLNRTLEKGYVLIRNLTLPGSDIVVPIILVGPMGIMVIFITNAKGFFEAKGDEWNQVVNERSQPARINLVTAVVRLSRALEKYMRLQNISYGDKVEPVLLLADPGAHVDSMRPAARVVQSDAIKQFAASVIQARPVLRNDQVYDIAERIVTPRPPATKPPQPEPTPAAPFADSLPPPSPPAFIEGERSATFNPADLDFAFSDEADPQFGSSTPSPASEPAFSAPPGPARAAPPKKRKIMGMTTPQFAVIAVMFIVECCVLVIGGYIVIMMGQ